MLKAICLLALLCLLGFVGAQPLPIKTIKKNKFIDSLQAIQMKEDMVYDLPIINLDENEKEESNVPFVPSVLTANRDVFMLAVNFHFSALRFRMRGYDANQFNTQINGVNMRNPDNGNTQFGLWSGLNDVTRNSQMTIGLRPADDAFGSIANSVSLDLRASKQREQTRLGYSFSNRSYTHRWMLTITKGMNRKGWSYAFSGSWRYAEQGYTPGTSYRGGSYYVSVDKKLAEKHLLSFVFFGSSVESGKQSPVLLESASLANSNYYNAYWGYQAGAKRNANLSRSHQPVLLLIHDHRIDNHTSLKTTFGFITGEKSNTAPDWYKAADPRPDYYRYLPSFQNDSVLRLSIEEAIKGKEGAQQIQWDKLYEINKKSIETISDANGIQGNSITGLRSHYIIEERVTAINRIDLTSLFKTQSESGIGFTAGLSFQLQQSHYCKRVEDLLGGEFYVDWNQFAERDFPSDNLAIQNDLLRPNRLLGKGDTFGYDYFLKTSQIRAWAQMVVTKKKVDFFVSNELSYSNFLREGNVTNGLFPDNSYGISKLHEFTDYACKAGVTYKINGRKYLYLHAAVVTKAALFEDVFISPRTRDTEQENTTSELIQTIEAGYVWNTPILKMRMSGYFTEFSNGMNITTFYHDAYRSFMNYALSGIDKLHFGIELGSEMKLSSQFSLNGSVAIGRYYYNNRQRVTISADNDAYVLERAVVYTKNFRIPGTPQEAYNLGLLYQSGLLYANLSVNYFRQNWLSFNPLRRTAAALQDVIPDSALWDTIINQTQMPDQFTANFSVGTSAKIKLFGTKKLQTCMINVSVNNLMNNQKIISSGYEQLRFDLKGKNVNQFPPKYFYAMGLNFSINFSLLL